jgi:hypothetical protein
MIETIKISVALPAKAGGHQLHYQTVANYEHKGLVSGARTGGIMKCNHTAEGPFK